VPRPQTVVPVAASLNAAISRGQEEIEMQQARRNPNRSRRKRDRPLAPWLSTATVRADLIETAGVIIAASLVEIGMGRDQATDAIRQLEAAIGDAADGKPSFAVVVPQPGGCPVVVKEGGSQRWCFGFMSTRTDGEKPIPIDLKLAVDVARGALEIGNAAETHLH